MNTTDIIRLRLINQGINRRNFTQPADVVSWMGAMQAQDYYASLWAIGLRMNRVSEDEIEKAISNKTIIRTWPMRGTLHFVAAEDVRWMLDLMTPRIISGSAGRFRRLGIDESTLRKSKDLIIKALQGGKQCARPEIYKLMEALNIPTSRQRGMQILWRMALEGLICAGPRVGKQHTFVLLDEWIPGQGKMNREEALTKLTRRYFRGHGPATVYDFSWWSGLTIKDARQGIEMVAGDLKKRSIDGQYFWFPDDIEEKEAASQRLHLLPAFDEYLVAYKDRSAALDQVRMNQVYTTNGIFSSVIIANGKVAGTWKRIVEKDRVIIETNTFDPWSKSRRQAIAREARRYGKFIGRPALVTDRRGNPR
ncbi:MAG TPA: winged helix DNA-binding domain-containing protein [Balneolales bacterium]|nr:winged helix DNA-binding domain-containing protein [Balneolales bacterium]